jgi:ribosomal-protein-alanine N-acetyltransferase
LLQLLPISKTLEGNERFANDASCDDTLKRTIAYFEKLGHESPWIGYYAEQDGMLIGTGAFKGPPKNNKVEIAYVIWEDQRSKGFGNEICAQLVHIWKDHDPSVILSAQTLPHYDHSNEILKKNGFVFESEFQHPEDGPVWE